MLPCHPSEGLLVAVLTLYYNVTFRLHCFCCCSTHYTTEVGKSQKQTATNLQQKCEKAQKGRRKTDYFFSLLLIIYTRIRKLLQFGEVFCFCSFGGRIFCKMQKFSLPDRKFFLRDGKVFPWGRKCCSKAWNICSRTWNTCFRAWNIKSQPMERKISGIGERFFWKKNRKNSAQDCLNDEKKIGKLAKKFGPSLFFS